MVSRVLVALDGSEIAEGALRYALDVHADAEITALTVVGEPSVMFGGAAALALADDREESMAEVAEPVLDRAREIAAEYDAEIDTSVRAGHPVRAILDAAEDYDAVVVGIHGGDLTDTLFVGNVADRVVRRSPVPVTVVR